uniref:GOLD domain-containing protein n=1 Tax=Parastrongyloides trichosuri TaxID=131310 RepID=A0A0N4ZI07_PARTI
MECFHQVIDNPRYKYLDVFFYSYDSHDKEVAYVLLQNDTKEIDNQINIDEYKKMYDLEKLGMGDYKICIKNTDGWMSEKKLFLSVEVLDENESIFTVAKLKPDELYHETKETIKSFDIKSMNVVHKLNTIQRLQNSHRQDEHVARHHAEYIFEIVNMYNIIVVIVMIVTCFIQVINSIHKFPKYVANPDAAGYVYDTKYFTVPVDEFSEANMDTYQLKYLINTTYYKPGGPIFFYTGNEGFIEGFADNTGIMWDIAPTFNAAVVFAEHRYYGQSANRPYGNNSKSSTAHLGYLTPNQALADYAKLIVNLKSTIIANATNSKVIVFGGSYGGMLSFWFRSKYPHIVDGAWASSAPIIYFQGSSVEWGAFDKVTTNTFQKSGCNTSMISYGWTALDNIGKSQDGLDWMNKNFNIDPKSTLKSANDVQYVKAYFQEAYEYMAMTDYGYSTNFLKQMPGLPVQYACQYLNGSSNDDKTIALNMYKAAMVYYNYNNSNGTNCVNSNVCGDEGTASLGDPDYWTWQECTTLVIQQCSMGAPNDMFTNQCGDGPTALMKQFCPQYFNNINYNASFLKPTEIPTSFGLTFNSISNVILTTGTYDPWYSGCLHASMKGMKEAQTKRGFYVLEIDGAAHHADLRQPNSCDSPNLVKARFEITRIINCWVNPTDGKCASFPFAIEDFGSFQPKNPNNCSYIYNKYPWGQKEPSANGVSAVTFSLFNIILVSVLYLFV